MLVALGLFASLGRAQTDSLRNVCVTLETNRIICGQLLSDDGRELSIQTNDIGVVVLPKVEVIRIEEVGPGEVLHSVGFVLDERASDPRRAIQATRYFFAPSAHPLKKGEGYSGLSLLTGANISYGVSDQAIVGLSLSFLGIGVTTKYSFQNKKKENVRYSMGGLAQLGWSGDGGIVFPFMNRTKGDENKQMTLGVGYLYGSSGLTDEINSPMLNASGSVRINDNSWFISENYYFFNPQFFPVNLVLSLGVRRHNPKVARASDVAILGLIQEDGTVIPLPWVSWIWPF